jgi:hypothetical protein
LADLDDVDVVEKAAREAMKARELVWVSGPEWTEAAFGGPPSLPPTIHLIQGRMRSTVSGHTIFIDAGDALWFWQDVRHVALRWPAFEEIRSEDRVLLKAINDEGGSRKLPGSKYGQGYDRLEAAGLIKSAAAAVDLVVVEVTLEGRRFLHWGK